MDFWEGAIGCEAGVIAVIAKVVEGFVGIFDCDLGGGGVGKEKSNDSVVKMGAVGMGLVGWEDQELGDAVTGRQTIEGEWVEGRENKVVGFERSLGID